MPCPSIGIEITAENDQVKDAAALFGYNFTVQNITRMPIEILPAQSIHPQNIIITDPQSVIGTIISCFNVDSEDENTRSHSEIMISQTTSWAAHIGLTHLMFCSPSLKGLQDGLNFSRTVADSLGKLRGTHALLRVDSTNAGWKSWNRLRMTSKHDYVSP